jgi:signal peptidase II
MMRLGLMAAGAALALDHLSKWWLMGMLKAPGDSIEILPFFNLVMVWNPGVSFGLFQSGNPWAQWILIAVAVAIVGFLLNWLRKADTRRMALSLGLIIGGAVGNAIDRILWGAVADFFDAHIGALHWPAFNVADSAIVIGALIMLFDGLFPPRGRDT